MPDLRPEEQEQPKDYDDAVNSTRPKHPSKRENDLYEEWTKAANDMEKNAVLKRLIPLLETHAAKIVWRTLRVNDSFLAQELAQDAAMDLDCFRQECAFSTWFHERCLRACFKEHRRRQRHKEISLTEFTEGRGILNKVPPVGDDPRNFLTPEQKELCAMKLKYGLTFEEIAEFKGVSTTTVRNLWNDIRTELKKIYDVGK